MTEAIKTIFRENLEKRFPVTEDIVCAALLDPGMKRLTAVEQYLVKIGVSKVNYLSNMCKKYCRQVEQSLPPVETVHLDLKICLC